MVNFVTCKFCETSVREDRLLKHQNESKQCKKYKGVIFSCKYCDFQTIGISNIEKHTSTCNSINKTKEILDEVNMTRKYIDQLYEELKTEKLRNKLYKDIIKNKTDINPNDISESYFETLKLSTNTQTTKKKTTKKKTTKKKTTKKKTTKKKTNNKKVKKEVSSDTPSKKVKKEVSSDTPSKKVKKEVSSDTLRKKVKKEVSSDTPSKKVKKEVSSDTPSKKVKKEVSSDTPSKKVKKEVSSDTPSKKVKKEVSSDTPSKEKNNPELVLKSIEHNVENVNDTIPLPPKCYKNVKINTEINQTVEDTISKNKLSIISKLNEYTYENFIKETADVLNEFKNQSRFYSCYLKKFRDLRLKLFGKIKLDKYLEMLREQISVVEKLLIEKGHSNKKRKSAILKYLTGVEARLLKYNNYETTCVDSEDLENLNFILSVQNSSTQYKQYSQYNNEYFFYNESLSLFNLEKNIKTAITNIYGLNNIIFLPLKTENPKNAFSFYTLDYVDKNKRYWKMDCRLKNLTYNIQDFLLNKMIPVFRDLYKLLNETNNFSKDYSTSSMDLDFEQLLQNIFYCIDTQQLFKIIKKVVIQNSIIKVTPNDYFNTFKDDNNSDFYANDKIRENVVLCLKKMFDKNISEEEALSFYDDKISEWL